MKYNLPLMVCVYIEDMKAPPQKKSANIYNYNHILVCCFKKYKNCLQK